jgi:hypothetical protein
VLLPSRAEQVVESIQITPGREATESFRTVPPPEGAPEDSDWREVEPTENWGAELHRGEVEFYLDTLRENDLDRNAYRMRIPAEAELYSSGRISTVPIQTEPGSVYRAHIPFKCAGVRGRAFDIRTVLRPEQGEPMHLGRYVDGAEMWTTNSSPWLAPPSSKSTLTVLVTFMRSPSDVHQDCWFGPIRVERAAVRVSQPREEKTVSNPAPVFSWTLLRADALQVSRDPDFPAGEATRNVSREQMPVAAFRFPDPFEPGSYHARIGFRDEKEAVRWSRPVAYRIAPRPAGRWAFDFGPEDSPVDPDALGVTSSTHYDPERGYGFVRPNALRAYSEPDSDYRAFEFADDPSTWRQDGGKKFNRNRTLTLNTPISRDFIEGEGTCTFRVDLPDGNYRVLLLAGHPGEWNPRVFEFEARTNTGRATFQKSYPKNWFELHGFPGAAADGRLDISLNPTAGDNKWVVNGILILSDQARRTGWGKEEWRRWYRDIYSAPTDYLDAIDPDRDQRLAEQQPAPPKPTTEEETSGLITYSRGTEKTLHPLTVPSTHDRIEKLSEVASREETIHSTFSVFTLRDFYSLQASLDELRTEEGHRIGPSQIQIRRMMAQIWASHTEFTRDWWGILMPNEELDLDALRTQQYMVTIYIPADTRPGRYKGSLKLTDEKGPVAALPCELEVTGIQLAPANQYLTLWANDHWEPESPDSEAAVQLLQRGKHATYRSLATHGFTVLDFAGQVRPVRKGDAYIVDVERIRKHVRDFRDAGGVPDFAHVSLAWGVSQSMLTAWAPDQSDKHKGKRIAEVIDLGQSFRDQFSPWIRLLDDCIRETGINRIVYQIHDEPHGGGEPEWRYVRDVGILIRKACPDSDVFVNTFEEPYMEYFASADELNSAPVATVWWPYGTVKEEKQARLGSKGVLFLNTTSPFSRGFEREGMGFMGWRARQFGATDWTFNPYYASANNFSDGPDFGTCMVLPTIPVITLHRWDQMQQGVFDMRYLKTLEKLIAGGKKSGNSDKAAQADAARALLDDFWSRLAPANRDMGGIDPATARLEVIRAIRSLMESVP